MADNVIIIDDHPKKTETVTTKTETAVSSVPTRVETERTTTTKTEVKKD